MESSASSGLTICSPLVRPSARLIGQDLIRGRDHAHRGATAEQPRPRNGFQGPIIPIRREAAIKAQVAMVAISAATRSGAAYE